MRTTFLIKKSIIEFRVFLLHHIEKFLLVLILIMFTFFINKVKKKRQKDEAHLWSAR